MRPLLVMVGVALLLWGAARVLELVDLYGSEPPYGAMLRLVAAVSLGIVLAVAPFGPRWRR